jgi:hypothetical protein
VVVLLIAGCGGGGGGGTPAASGPAIDTVTVGRISAGGSIVVNGIAWDTAGAAVTIDGLPAAPADLRPGDVVAVAGSAAAGAARAAAVQVDVRTAVRGPVVARGIARPDDSRYATGLVVEVLGQYVLVDAATLAASGIDPATGAGLAPGTLVEVAGFHSFWTTTDPLATQQLGFATFFDLPVWRATRIVPAPPGAPLLVTGVIDATDPVSHRLTLGRLDVDLATATTTGFGAGGPAVGDRVRVTGTAQGADGSLVADRVEPLADILAGLPTGTDATVEGFREATDPGSAPGAVTIGGATLTLTGAPTPAAAGPYRVAATTSAAGTPGSLATLPGQPGAPTSALRAPVDAIAGDGSLQVLGRSVRPDPRAAYADRRVPGLGLLAPTDLGVGDLVTVAGCVPGEAVPGEPACPAPASGEDFLATQVLREADDAGIGVRGSGGERDGTAFALPALGFFVETTPATGYTLLGAALPDGFDPLDCVGGGQFVGITDTLRVAGSVAGPVTFTALAVDFEGCGAFLPLPP